MLAGLQQPGLSQVLPFENYSIKDGLLSNWITCLYQDSRGYLWIGSNEGLSVYDGIQFKSYTITDGLPVSQVWCITESRMTPGTMWIGTSAGLSKNAQDTFSNIRVGSTPGSNVINAIVEDGDGTLWCGTNGGLYRVPRESRTAEPVNFVSGVVSSMVLLDDSSLCLATSESVFLYSKITGKARKMVTTTIPDDPAFALVRDEDEVIWIVTKDSTLYQTQRGVVIASRKLPFRPWIGSAVYVFPDKQGSLWIGTHKGILTITKSKWLEEEFIHYTAENGLPDNSTTCGLIDREDNLWIGSFTGGLAKLSRWNAFSFPLKSVIPAAMNLAAAADAHGHLFVNVDNGIHEIWKSATGDWHQHLHVLKGVELPSRPNAVHIAEDGTLWIFFHLGGASQYKVLNRNDAASRLVLLRALTSGVDLPRGWYTGVFIDGNHLLYAIEYAGVFQFDLTKSPIRKLQTITEGLPGPSVRVMYRDRAENLWLGEFSYGLALYTKSGGEWRWRRTFTTIDGLPDNNIRAIWQWQNGELWIGTRYGGIAILKDEKIQILSTKDGLLSNTIFAFAEDENGRLWIGTSLGLQSVAPENPRQFVAHRELEGKSLGSVGVMNNGAVWGASWGGVVIYEHHRDDSPPVPPPIYLTSLRMNGTAVLLQENLKFSYDENLCEINFTGISFKNPQALRYQYRLLKDQADAIWQPPTAQRTVTYAALPPGTHTFEVKAINTDGVESASTAALTFTIVPPFWQRWWFRTSGVAALVGIVIVLERMRTRRLLEIEKIRSRIATDLHDDIGAGLTHIGLLSEVMLRKHSTQGKGEPSATQNMLARLDDFNENTARVGSIARELSEAMSDVVWSINPKHDSLDALLHRLTAFAHEICKAKDISLNFTVDEKISSMKLNPEERRSLLLIAKEALHNMAKYSGSASVEVHIESDARTISLTVQDFGNGFDVAKSSTGNGLSNMRSRATKLGGICEIHSGAGKGTRIVASIPVRK